MQTSILMPALSPTMTAGTLARWLKREGEAVSAGDVLAEIETDKATMEFEAADDGVLERILVPEGTANVAVNAPIALLMTNGAAIAAPVAAAGDAGPANEGSAEEKAAEKTRVFASPLARRIAAAAGIDLRTVSGSGPNGRIVRADIEKVIGSAEPTPVAARVPAAEASVGAHRIVPHSAMRRIIGRRLTEAKQTIPHFYLTVEMRIDALLKLRGEINAHARDAARKVSVNDLVIKAASLALRQVPEVNCSYSEQGTVLFDDVDIAVAVAVPDGLLTPIIRRADCKGVVAIGAEMKDLAARAKDGRLKPEEFQGGGFTISNLGMYGVRQFAAVINPPQGAILAVGAGEQRAVVMDGALAVGTAMSCTLSVDHRVIDGALGARWLQAFRTVIEDPLAILL